ncbi:hypothetical protein GD416_28060 [Burkholderia sp. BE24]|uniref:hypothetical protein n=1 Tax=Burkholderia TaxID=32008 RepID=UPI00117E4BEA|nr:MULTISPECIES: hypothetical protein [Burkholderia]MPV60172.1 hypothetical protein [Burkholderia sp. BE24]
MKPLLAFLGYEQAPTECGGQPSVAFREECSSLAKLVAFQDGCSRKPRCSEWPRTRRQCRDSGLRQVSGGPVSQLEIQSLQSSYALSIDII